MADELIFTQLETAIKQAGNGDEIDIEEVAPKKKFNKLPHRKVVQLLAAYLVLANDSY